MAEALIPASVLDVEDAAELAHTDLTQCVLLVNAGMRRFSYAILDPARDRFLSLREFSMVPPSTDHAHLRTLEQLFDANKLLYTDFREVRLSVDFPEFAIVPAALFDAARKKQYYQMLFPGQPSPSVYADNLPEFDAVNLFGVDKNTVGYLKKEFGSSGVFHTETALLRGLRALAGPEENISFLRLLPGRVTLTVFSRGSLLLMQAYRTDVPEDGLYHVLNAWKQLGLNARDMRLQVFGEGLDNDPLYQALSRAGAQCGWLEALASGHFVYAFHSLPPHRFYHLTALGSCV